MNSTIRPMLTFAIVTMIIVAGFWAVLTYATGYNRDLRQKASETTQKQPERIAAVDTKEPQAPASPQSKPTTPAPSPQPQAGSQTPSPTTPQTATAKPPAQPQTATVPATGSNAVQTLLLAVTLGASVYLAVRLYAQSLALRPNR